jgi:hypothetical protein
LLTSYIITNTPEEEEREEDDEEEGGGVGNWRWWRWPPDETTFTKVVRAVYAENFTLAGLGL